MKLQKQINNNMATNKTAITTQTTSHECCMCGDFGFPYELFQCKVCHIRSQHRYCSNLYPNVAESHRICNWCLTQKDDAKEKSQNSSNSSSSFKNDVVTQDNHDNKKVKNSRPEMNKQLQRHPPQEGGRSGLMLGRHGGVTINCLQLNAAGGPIKKQRLVEVSPSPSPSPVSVRKRIITAAAKEAERLRRTRSEDIANVGITRQVFRNRVRRYKLLDEVSS